MTDELVERLLDWPYQGETMAHEAADRIEAMTAERDGLLRCVTDNHVALCRAEAAEAERDRLREALEQIEIACEEEIRARTAGMSEAALGKSRILPLLQVPRNIARAALKGESHD